MPYLNQKKRYWICYVPNLSVVIPIGPNETSIDALISDLTALTNLLEIICVTTDPSTPLPQHPLLTTVSFPAGRSRQLNEGCKTAKGDWIWILHADSRIPRPTTTKVCDCVCPDHSQTLFYGELAFIPPHPKAMILNAIGANIRSRSLNLPFGDQGFLFSKEVWKAIGPFTTAHSYGEDHLFVWAAKRRHLSIQSLERPVYTSARKYQRNGWLRTTIYHQYLFWKQAIPQFFKRDFK